jgi:SnoaL-like domain/Family of unknown function (DUF5519)
VPQPDADLAKQREAVDAFLAASRAGDFEALVAVLDPDVVLRARGARELEQELHGAAEVAGSMARFGPRFASMCHPATVNGEPGLVLQTVHGALGAVGFTVSGGLITTIDFTLDPDTDEPGLLNHLRARQGSVGERIISEALSWPGVRRETGDFGSVVLRLGPWELGHLHGDAVADVPIADDDSGWVAVSLETEEDVQRALALMRGNYERGHAQPSR